jgi:hypothetical protein
MAKREYLAAMNVRYRRASSRREKTLILTEICMTYGCHRKHAIRLLAQMKKARSPRVRRRGRRPTYVGSELLRPLRTIWLAANLPCSKRLRVILALWLPSYEESYGPLDDEVRRKLQNISATTIDRLLERARIQHTRKGRATTKPGTLLRKQIPIATGQWRQNRPGFVEADTVAHCGTTVAGQFAWTLDCVDIATGWSEQRAIWSKEDQEIVKQMRSIEKALPFPLLGFDSDNGSEFINHKLLAHFLQRRHPIQFTRSRAYHKDDNAHVEQKNWTHVRQWLGYDRLDHPDVVDALNDLYTKEWRWFHNLYCPSVKLVSKERIGSKNVKKHDSPKTPYQRVMESTHVSEYAKRGLQQIFESTNPFVLRKIIEKKISRVFKLCARTDQALANHDGPSALAPSGGPALGPAQPDEVKNGTRPSPIKPLRKPDQSLEVSSGLR